MIVQNALNKIVIVLQEYEIQVLGLISIKQPMVFIVLSLEIYLIS